MSVGLSDRIGETDTITGALRIVRRRWPVVLGGLLLGTLAAVVLTVGRTATYSTTAEVLFSAGSTVEVGVSRNFVDPQRQAATEVKLATSRTVAERAARAVGGGTTPGGVLTHVAVQASENSDVLEMKASDTDPARAATLANALAHAYVDVKTAANAASLNAQERVLTAELGRTGLTEAARADLQQKLLSVAAGIAVTKQDARVIGEAQRPETPSSMSPRKAGILGAILGLALGLMLAFLIESLDRRISSLEEFEREYRARVLAVVPERAFKVRAGAQHVVDLEPFRILRSALDIQRSVRDINVVMVTSAMPGEGKTTVAVDLAHAIALAGRAVTVVELDLRRPTFSRHFELTERSGVTTALVGRASATDLVQHPVPQLRQLSVLPAGPLPPNPTELLDSAALRQLMLDLRADGRLLVLDSPPLIPVADSHVLLKHPLVDAGLIVARQGVTTRDQARRARTILDNLAFEPMGVVVTGSEASQGYYGPDSYAAKDPVEPAA